MAHEDLENTSIMLGGYVHCHLLSISGRCKESDNFLKEVLGSSSLSAKRNVTAKIKTHPSSFICKYLPEKLFCTFDLPIRYISHYGTLIFDTDNNNTYNDRRIERITFAISSLIFYVFHMYKFDIASIVLSQVLMLQVESKNMDDDANDHNHTKDVVEYKTLGFRIPHILQSLKFILDEENANLHLPFLQPNKISSCLKEQQNQQQQQQQQPPPPQLHVNNTPTTQEVLMICLKTIRTFLNEGFI